MIKKREPRTFLALINWERRRKRERRRRSRRKKEVLKHVNLLLLLLFYFYYRSWSTSSRGRGVCSKNIQIQGSRRLPMVKGKWQTLLAILGRRKRWKVSRRLGLGSANVSGCNIIADELG